jgi:hypothetical protein
MRLEVYLKDTLELCLPHCFRIGTDDCAIWRGNMSDAISEVKVTLGEIYPFYLFEGLPDASKNDNISAMKYKNKTIIIDYHDTCKAEIEFTQKIMHLAGAPNIQFIKGWF